MTQPDRKPVTLRMPRILRDKLAEKASEEGVSLNDWIVSRLTRKVEE